MTDRKELARNNASWRTAACIAILLILSTAAAYWNVNQNGFLGFDDGDYITENPNVNHGLSWRGVRWALVSFDVNNWHPLTWLSHMADVSLFGMQAGGHHLVSLWLHILNTLLLFAFLQYTTKRHWASAVVAALFALHPLHVESVAWASERKDVLSTFFWLATMLAYAWHIRRPSAARYAAALLLFAMGLMAKPMLVTLPLILLLLDYWPLQRTGGKTPPLRLAAEKLPFFALSAASCAVTLIAQRQAIGTLASFDLASRSTNALVSYGRYIWKTFWPADLAVYYVHHREAHWLAAAIITLCLLAITLGVLLAARRRRYLLTGWLWYLVTLVPVIGFVQVGAQSHADRYTYVPLIGLFIAIVWLVDELAARHRPMAGMAAVAAIAILALAGWHTRQMVGYWKNDETLFTRAATVAETNSFTLLNLALARLEEGETESAIDLLRKSLEINPDSSNVRSWLGLALAEAGRLDEGMSECRKVLELDPQFGPAHFRIAGIYVKKGLFEQAATEYRKSLAIRPDYAAWSNLGSCLRELRRPAEAEEAFRKALGLQPDSAAAHYNLAMLLSEQGRVAEAIAEMRIASRIAPDNQAIQEALVRMMGR